MLVMKEKSNFIFHIEENWETLNEIKINVENNKAKIVIQKYSTML